MKKTISDLLKVNKKVYGVPNDRFHDFEDLFYYQEKYLLRYFNKISKSQTKDAILNLMVSTCWFFALINRLHVDLDEGLKTRYSYKCPYCLEMPCFCNKEKDYHSKKTGRPTSMNPKYLSDWQGVIAKIYPEDNKGKLYIELLHKLDSFYYTVRNLRRRLVKSRIREVKIEATDYFVLVMRLFNSLNIDFTEKYEKLFDRGCYVCHKTPCECFYFE